MFSKASHALTCLALLCLLPLALAGGPSFERETIVSGPMGGRLDDYMKRCEQFGFSGSVLVARGSQVFLRKGYGEARPGEDVMNTPETLYDIASASKQFTAAAILLLESQGKLSTSDSIAKHLHAVPSEHHEVTIQHLLNHTSGFSRYGTTGSGRNRDAAISKFLSAKRSRRAGAKHEYYNGGYTMLAAIVERVADADYETWVSENLFNPAGLQKTEFTDTIDPEEPLLARSHDNGKLTTDYIKGWGYKGMGGVITSVSDLHLWMRALSSGKILPEESLEKLWTPALEKYACGWYVGEHKGKQRVISHGGTASGFQSYIRYFAEEDVVVLLTSNREGMHWQVTWGLSAIVVDDEAKVPAPPATADWPEEKLDELAGRYSSKAHGDFVVSRAGKSLRIGAEGAGSLALLSGSKPIKSSEFKWECEKAEDVVTGLMEGTIEPLSRILHSSNPPGWPRILLTKIWPSHLDTHGPLKSFQVTGASQEGDRVHVWIRLQHEDGDSGLKIAFIDRGLKIFDLKATHFPLERSYAPVDKKKSFEAYTFSDESHPKITLETKSKGRAVLKIEVKGKRYEFERPGE